MISKVLTDDQISMIHNTSLAILERVGVVVPHERMLGMFADAGAKVDYSKQLLRIPAELVLRLVASAGKEYTLYGRDLSKTASFGQGKRNYNTIAGEALWLDNIGGQRRYAALGDAVAASRFADALGYINIAGAMSDPHEIPTEYRCVEILATMIRNTTKPVHIWFHDRASAKYIIDMLIVLRGSAEDAEKYPYTYSFLEPISPLRFPEDGIDLLFETARLNMPCAIGPMAQTGLSAPVTLAATMAQENAEILAGVCITQLIRPGMPVCYGGLCHAFDMCTTQMIFCGPEQAIFGVAMTQLGKSYGFPVYVNTGLTDAKRPDAQAGLEIASTLTLSASAGADIFGHMGICGVDQAASLDMLVLQHETISYIESVLREVQISDETLGLTEIEEVGPGGTYIDREFTATHFRKELWIPELLNRDYYQTWLDGGKSSMEERCRAYKDKILSTHTVDPVPAELDKALGEIVSSAKLNLLKG